MSRYILSESLFEDYVKDSLNEAVEGTYSDKFKKLVSYILSEKIEPEKVLKEVTEQIINYCPEEILKDLWFHGKYDEFMKEDNSLNTSDEEKEFLDDLRREQHEQM